MVRLVVANSLGSESLVFAADHVGLVSVPINLQQDKLFSVL